MFTVSSWVCQELAAHGTVLERGVSLARAVSLSEALSGTVPCVDGSVQCADVSCEREFLGDFINATPHTSAARLAKCAPLNH